MDDEPRLDASRPSSLRLAGFALTAVGALLLGIGSRLVWVTVGLGSVSGSQTAYLGTDLGAGKIALGGAAAVLVLVLIARMTSRWRRWVSVAIIAVGSLVAALAGWFIVAAPDHYSPVDDERLVSALSGILRKSPDEIRAGLASVIDKLGGYTHVGPGPWVVIVGGVLVAVGGILTLRWTNRLRASASADDSTPSHTAATD